MPEIAEVRGAEGHRVSVYLVEPSEQGLARCTCGWSRQDVLVRNVHDAALRHARATTKTTAGATSATQASGCPPGDRGLAVAPVVPQQSAQGGGVGPSSKATLRTAGEVSENFFTQWTPMTTTPLGIERSPNGGPT